MNRNKFTIATLNIKGLNNRHKYKKTLTLLKTYNIDLIMLQETNLDNEKNREFIKRQWAYESFWTAKAAILAGNSKVELKDLKESHRGRVITGIAKIKQYICKITNVYAPPHMSE